MIRIFLIVGLLAFFVTPVFAEEVTIPDLNEAVNSASISKDKEGQLVIKVPERPEFEQPLYSLVNRDLLVPTERGLVFRPEVSEQEIVAALVRHGLSIATETNKTKAEIEDLKEANKTQDEEIAWLTGEIVQIKEQSSAFASSLRQAFWLAVLALGIGIFLLTSTLRRVQSWQGKATPPADEPDDLPVIKIEDPPFEDREETSLFFNSGKNIDPEEAELLFASKKVE